MKIKTKKILGMVLASATVVGLMGGAPVYAASSKTGYINGIRCSGSVSYSKTPAGVPNGIKANTYFSGCGSLKVTATVYYKVAGKKHTKTVSNSVAGVSGAISATANTNDEGNVYGGKGTHSVNYDEYSWGTVTTTIGTTW